LIEFKKYASGSSGNFYTAFDGTSTLMIECGILYKKIQENMHFKVTDACGCLLTHLHKDHSKSIKDIIKSEIETYMSKGTKDALCLDDHRVNIIKHGQIFKIGSFDILTFNTQHDVVEPLGFLIKSGEDKLLFATDTFYLKNLFPGCTHIAVECNYAADILEKNVKAGIVPPLLKKRVERSHFSLENVLTFLEKNDLSRCREIHLLHISKGNGDPERFQGEVENLTGIPTYI